MKKSLILLATVLFLCSCATTTIANRPLPKGFNLQISKTPPTELAVKLYKNPRTIELRGVNGFYDPDTRTAWARNKIEAFHEEGHFRWSQLTEKDQDQWREWFAEGNFCSAYSKINVGEFFAEHFKQYCVRSWEESVRTGNIFSQERREYKKLFPIQFKWLEEYLIRSINE